MGKRLPADLTVGFEEIDVQHGAIFEALDAARDAAIRGDLAATRTAVASLGDLLVSHFASEEAFMAESLYPDRNRHKAAHDLFMQDFALLGRELQSGLTALAAQWVALRLPEWVRFHIRVNDSALARFLSSRSYRPAGQTLAATKSTAS